MAKTTPIPAEFEPEFVQGLTSIFEDRIVFNQVMGLKVTGLAPDRVTGRIVMKHELVGHFSHNRVHGGVISATLDAMGGLAVMAAIGARHMDEPAPQRLQRFSKLGTIDLRIDYLRPGVSSARFHTTATLVRLGSRVGNTTMQFTADDGTLIAMGTAAYIVS